MGPLNQALKWIIGGANYNRSNDNKLDASVFTDLYRGLTLPSDVI